MSKIDVIRAWKDEEYRLGLSEAERASLPEHPAGIINLTDFELSNVAGAATRPMLSMGCDCPETYWCSVLYGCEHKDPSYSWDIRVGSC